MCKHTDLCNLCLVSWTKGVSDCGVCITSIKFPSNLYKKSSLRIPASNAADFFFTPTTYNIPNPPSPIINPQGLFHGNCVTTECVHFSNIFIRLRSFILLDNTGNVFVCVADWHNHICRWTLSLIWFKSNFILKKKFWWHNHICWFESNQIYLELLSWAFLLAEFFLFDLIWIKSNRTHILFIYHY